MNELPDEATFRAVDRALDALPGATAPADFATRVLRRARRRGRILRAASAAAAAAVALALFLPRPRVEDRPDVFTADDYIGYVWEADAETYGSLALDDLRDEILAEVAKG